MTDAMCVLVTGGAGSMGRELVRALMMTGHRVRAFDLPGVDWSPLGDMPGVEVIKGDITGRQGLLEAVAGVDAVVHLAAILPPASEAQPDLTMRVNLEGTRNIVWALEEAAPRAHLVFSSSVSTYGDTSQDQPPITCAHPQAGLDTYAKSKILAEEVVRGSSLSYTALRVSGVAVPAFLAPPQPWPFMREQRIEFVARDDVVRALVGTVEVAGARGKVLSVAGGRTWRMLGREYVACFNELVGLAPEEAEYLDIPGYYDWYHTQESQALLGYQKTPFPRFLELTRKAIGEFLGLDDENGS